MSLHSDLHLICRSVYYKVKTQNCDINVVFVLSFTVKMSQRIINFLLLQQI